MSRHNSLQKNNFLIGLGISFLFLALVLAFFKKVLFFKGDYIIQGCDLIQTYYQKLFYKESLLSHHLPLWNPYIYSGYPFLAHPYNGVFYPLNLLFLLMPINVAYSWIYALHVFLAGIFMLMLVRHLTKDWWAAAISALAFMFSGFTVSRIWAGHFELFTTSVWIPLVFLFFLKTFEKKSILFAFFTGFFLAIQFFAGHNQTFFFTLLILLAYTLFICRDGIPERIGSNLSVLLGVVLIFFIFSAIQLFPTLEFTRLSTRGSGIPFFKSAYGSFPPDHLIRFLFPEFFGDILRTLYYGDPILGEVHWEFNYYIGILPLLIALYAMWKGLNEKAKRIFILMISLAFICSISTRIIFLELWRVRNNPSMGKPIVLRLVQFLEGIYNGEISMWKIIPLVLIFIIVIVMIFRFLRQRLISPVMVSHKNDKIILFFVILSLVGIILAFGHYSGGFHYLLYKIFPGYNQFKWPSRHLIITNFALCVLAGFGISQLKKARNYAKLLLAVFILLDLFYYGNKYLYLKNLNEFYPSGKIVSHLRDRNDDFRILSLPVRKPGCFYEPSCSEFQSNCAIPLRVSNVTGYDPMILRRYHEFTNILQNLKENDFGDVTIRIKDLSNINFLKLLNVKYLFAGDDFSKYKLHLGNFESVENTSSASLLRFKGFLPRFIFVDNAIIAEDDANLKFRLFAKDFNPEKSVLLESWQSPVAINAEAAKSYDIQVIKYTPNAIEIEALVGTKGYLVSSEIYYPGWKAFLDGKPVKIFRSNYALRSVFIPLAGKHKIQYKFEPKSLKTGFLITLLGLCLFIFYCMAYSNKKIRARFKLS